MQYIDMHCDTLAEGVSHKKKTITSMETTMVDIARLKKTGTGAQFFAMFVPQKAYHKEFTDWFQVPETADEETLLQMMYEVYQNTLKENESCMAFARSYEKMQENLHDGKISAFLTMENGYTVKGDMDKLKKYHDMGVGLMTLTWNDPNCFGFPHSKEPEKMKQGLTDFGKEAIEVMNDIGMIVDVSHLSDGGFMDVAEISKKPFVASHSNCRTLCPATRNLTDEMIRILGEKGGIAGINFEPSFLNADVMNTRSTVERMCDHIEHFIKTGGTDCVGIGTDFDGIGGDLEINDCIKMNLLFDALHRRKISDDVIEKVAYRNAARVIKESMR